MFWFGVRAAAARWRWRRARNCAQNQPVLRVGEKRARSAGLRLRLRLRVGRNGEKKRKSKKEKKKSNPAAQWAHATRAIILMSDKGPAWRLFCFSPLRGRKIVTGGREKVHTHLSLPLGLETTGQDEQHSEDSQQRRPANSGAVLIGHRAAADLGASVARSVWPLVGPLLRVGG